MYDVGTERLSQELAHPKEQELCYFHLGVPIPVGKSQKSTGKILAYGTKTRGLFWGMWDLCQYPMKSFPLSSRSLKGEGQRSAEA